MPCCGGIAANPAVARQLSAYSLPSSPNPQCKTLNPKNLPLNPKPKTLNPTGFEAMAEQRGARFKVLHACLWFYRVLWGFPENLISLN